MHTRLGLLALPLIMIMNACVIPIAPQFDDPEVNYPPFLVDSDPAVGDILTMAPDTNGGPAAQRAITVTLGDHNLNDVLFLRLLLDYPTTDPGDGQLLAQPAARPPSARVDRTPFRLVPPPLICRQGSGIHRLVLSVSDREFLDGINGDSVSPEAPLDSVRAGANRMRAVWLLN